MCTLEANQKVGDQLGRTAVRYAKADHPALEAADGNKVLSFEDMRLI